MQYDNVKPLEPDDPRFCVVTFFQMQEAILDASARIVALEKRVDRLEREAKAARRKFPRPKDIRGAENG